EVDLEHPDPDPDQVGAERGGIGRDTERRQDQAQRDRRRDLAQDESAPQGRAVVGSFADQRAPAGRRRVTRGKRVDRRQPVERREQEGHDHAPRRDRRGPSARRNASWYSGRRPMSEWNARGIGRTPKRVLYIV